MQTYSRHHPTVSLRSKCSKSAFLFQSPLQYVSLRPLGQANQCHSLDRRQVRITFHHHLMSLHLAECCGKGQDWFSRSPIHAVGFFWLIFVRCASCCVYRRTNTARTPISRFNLPHCCNLGKYTEIHLCFKPAVKSVDHLQINPMWPLVWSLVVSSLECPVWLFMRGQARVFQNTRYILLLQ